MAYSLSTPSCASVGMLGVPIMGGARRLHNISRPAPISTSGQKSAHESLRKPRVFARNSAPIPTRMPPVALPFEYGESTILASPAAIRITGQKRQMSCM